MMLWDILSYRDFPTRFALFAGDDAAAGGGGAPPASVPTGGDSGGGSTSPASPTNVEDTTATVDNIFDGFEEASDEIEVAPQGSPLIVPGTPRPAPVPPASTSTAAPKAPAAGAAPVPPGQPQAAVPPAPEPPAPPPPATPSSASFSLDDPDSIASVLDRETEAMTAHLAQTMFALSEKDRQALEDDALAVLPSLLAKGVVEGQKLAMRSIAKIVPAMITKQITGMRSSIQSENEFFTRWPQIDRAANVELVKRFAIALRQTNPQMTKAQMIDEVGAMVCGALKVPTQVAAAVPGAHVPVAANGAHRVVTPFVPAGGGGAVPQGAPSNDPWAGLGEEHE